MPSELTSTVGIVALAAAALALIALVLLLITARRLRALRTAQTLVLGPHGERDLIAHAERVEQGFGDLRDWVEEVLGNLDVRLGESERRLDGCVAHRALIRYDAYGELAGQQSSSVALLDSHRSGVVISSILHRDSARVYVKQVSGGASELDLSPEEERAIAAALATGG